MSRPGRKDDTEASKYSRHVEYSENRRAFVNLPGNSFVLFTDPAVDREGARAAPNVTMKIMKSNGSFVVFNMTLFTSEELAALREFFLMATSTALPATDLMDETAQKELDNGIDSDPRLYREVPRLFVREGEKFGDHPRLLRGHEWDNRFPSYEQSAGLGFAKRGRRSPVPKQAPQDRAAHDGEAEVGEH